ncbi:MAG TPA: TonB-dependent receptor [Pyrinomonadaceae bacterium]|jgi:hypothetical protein
MGLAQRSSLRTIFRCGLFLFLAVATANAQFRAAVQGSVTDPQGGSIVGATVTLTNNETNRAQQATTGDEGFYRFSGLPPGRYTLTVEQAGFGKRTLENVVVNAEATEGINVTLETASLSETITVTDVLAPPLETENANIGKAITNQEIRQLPQFGRDPYELLRLTPGVFGQGARGGSGSAVNLPNQTGPGGSDRAIFQTENQVQIVANGQRVSANNFQIDGTSVNSLTHGGAAIITPNQESVKEVRVIANNYSAEYGRNSGAQILTVSQNGTNNFHGSLFLKNNSPGLNSFNKYGGLFNAPAQRVNQRLNQFGGSFGGPLPLPRFGEGAPPAFKLGRDRAFFFFSYEGLRSSTVSAFNAIVETPEFRNLVQQRRPGSVTAQIFAAPGIAPRVISVIPITCGGAGFNNDNCRQLAGGLDIGSPAGATGQYLSFGNLQGGGFDNIPDLQFAQLALPNVNRGNQYNPRLDFNFTDRDTLTVSSYLSRFNGVGSDPAGRSRPMGDIGTAPENSFVTVAYMRTLSPTMLNEARFNATRYAYNEIESSSGTPFNIPRIEIETLPGDRLRFGPPRAETTPGIFAENTFEFRDTLRWVRGAHGLSFGGELRKEQDNNNLGGGARPLYTFAGLFNLANDAPLFYSINADPRTGGPAEAQRYFRTDTYAFFVQDDWKARPNLTLNLGMRYEYFSPLREKRGRLSNFILGAAGQELTGGRIAVVDELYEADRNNFAPRLGFAWSPSKILGTDFADKLVVRGGFGIAYNRLPVNVFENTRGNPPFFARYNICCGTAAQDFSTPFAGGQILYALGTSNSPFSYPVNPALALTFNPTNGIPVVRPGSEVEIYGAPADVATPYVYTYSLETQYSLQGNLTAEVGYQGSSSHKLVRLVDQRFLYPNDPGNFFASRIIFPLTDTNANYNAMIARLSRRFSRGFQFDAHYRWSKSIDVISSEQVGAPNPTYPLDPRQERGPSDFDVRHHFVASGLWELPIFRNRKDTVGKILGGWQLSGILTKHTGFPWTPLLSDCVSTRGPSLCPARPVAYFGGAGTDTSNEAFLSGSNFPGGGTRFFSTTTPGAQLPGIGRNTFRGPRYFNIDMSATKRFGMPGFLGEGAAFEFKANFFNAFNILNLQQFGFNSAPTIITNPNFGRADGALAGRVIELQGRLIF